jgi:hypothetical protein
MEKLDDSVIHSQDFRHCDPETISFGPPTLRALRDQGTDLGRVTLA